jgi:ketosteroid isomerase-like protein
MSSEHVTLVNALLAELPTEFEDVADHEQIRRRGEETLARHAAPGFDFVMAGPDPAFKQTATGIEGFGEAWFDWLAAFESFRIDVGELIDAGEHVLALVRLSGRTRTGGVPIEQPGAAVFTCRNGKITRIEFHLDLDRAYAAAGLTR